MLRLIAAIFSVVLLAPGVIACGAELLVFPGADPQLAANRLRNGDTLLLEDGTIRGSIELRNLRDVTISARRVKPVRAQWDEQRKTWWATGPSVTIDATGRPFGVRLIDCSRITLRGFIVDGADTPQQKGGVAFENCEQIVVEDIISQRNNDSGFSGGTVPENLATRKAGFRYLRTVAQGNGAAGHGMSFVRQIRYDDCASFYNGRGWHKNVWGENGYQRDGKWYCNVMFTGGNKWAHIDDAQLNRFWTSGQNGVGIWFDWLNTNIRLNHCLLENSVWVQHDYDSVGVMFEGNQGPHLVEDCLFRGNVIGTNVCESANVRFVKCTWIDDAICHRNLDRGVRIGNVIYDACRFSGDGAIFGWWDGIKSLKERAERNIDVMPNCVINAPPPTEHDWSLGSSLLAPP
jgi:hypothetical protein